MGNALFLYRNLLYETGVTLTPSSEAGDHDADNLLNPDPTSFWRATTITSPITLTVDFGSAKVYDSVALLYTNATPHTNVVQQSDDGSHASWAKTNLTGVTVSTGTLLNETPPVQEWTLQEDSTVAAEHKIRNSTISLLENSGATPLSIGLYVSLYVKTNSDRNCRLRLENSAGHVHLNIDCTGASVSINSTSTSAWSISSSGVDTTGDYPRVWMLCVPSGVSGDTPFVEVGMLDGSFNASYNGDGASELVVGGLLIDDGESSLREFVSSGTTTGSYFTQDGISLLAPQPIALYSTEVEWEDSSGWVHSYYKYPVALVDNNPILYIHDPNNADGYFDLPLLFIGRSFQPARNTDFKFRWIPNISEPLGNDAPGGQDFWGAIGPKRRWQMRWPLASKADAMEFQAMHQKVGRNVPVALILNPDEATYGQEEILCGRIIDMRISSVGKDSSGNDLYDVDVVMQEVIP